MREYGHREQNEREQYGRQWKSWGAKPDPGPGIWRLIIKESLSPQ